MKTKIYTLCIALFLLNSSCNDGFLDTTPYDSISSANIFSNDTYALYALHGAYNTLAQNSFGPDFYVPVSVLGPEGYGRTRGDWGISQGMGIADARSNIYKNNYRNFYRTIIYANDIIVGLEGNENVTETVRNQYIGEAKFLRGLCYFYLWNLFGGVVILDKPIAVEESYLPRNTEEEVLDLIIADFSDAIARLPVSNEGRATKGAAIAMLGKTYLYNQQWPEAAKQFETLLAAPFEYDLVENYADNFRFQTQNNEESVFEIQYSMNPGAGSSFDSYFGNRTVGVSGQDYCEMSQRAFKAFTYADDRPIDFSTIPQRSNYSDDITYGNDLTDWYQEVLTGVDKRLHQSAILPGSRFLGYPDILYKYYWPITAHRSDNPPGLWHTFGNDAIIPIRKLVTVGQENTVGRTVCPTNFPVIRFADVLLMYAEAKNEVSGPDASVYNAVDRVRERAELLGLATLKPSLSKDEMRKEIRLERFREFMFESILYFDARRWHIAHTNDPIFGLNNHTEVDFRLMTEWYTKKFREDRDYLWPIPGEEIDINPLMTQNPGWQSQ